MSQAEEPRKARRHWRRWLLLWLACVAVCWALVIVVGYVVVRFGAKVAGGD